MVTQFHGIEGQCVTLSKAYKTTLIKREQEWASVLHELVDALGYVHKKELLHNDIKGDNVVIAKQIHFQPVLIDFGKCRKVKDAKLYRLNKEEQHIYTNRYWHIAPELIRGTHTQSFASDVFSLGVMLNTLFSAHKFKKLKDLSKELINSNPIERPMLSCIKVKLLEIME